MKGTVDCGLQSAMQWKEPILEKGAVACIYIYIYSSRMHIYIYIYIYILYIYIYIYP